jgi:beta-phosphoglucomutase-like phosphatase (HAD superfamily)
MGDPLQLVIFDCDGVLVDSERLAVRVEAAMLADLGWPLSEAEVVERFMGRSQACMVEAILARLGDRLPDGWQDRFDRRYRAAFDAERIPVPERLEGPGTVLFDDMRRLPELLAATGA